ncbi:hypothetical protein [Streptomyces abyssomicinicus]|uniref:hypothetical protein n=1 Tax=Streptomyces abyssomicinicus TaxID=574929 RepID=UPI001250BE2D|nr:hypothetical protein [Streptomyces abyssomicinicus]
MPSLLIRWLALREPEARDRVTFIELLASPEAHTYLGGPWPRDELEPSMPVVPERWPILAKTIGARLAPLMD